MSGTRVPGGQPMSCEQLREVAAELALDVLDGAERAAALAHLERCAGCRAEVTQLTETGAQLLLLAPQAPPPAGFEQRVLDRISAASSPAASSPPVTDIPSLDRRGRRGRRVWRGRRVLIPGLVSLLVLAVATLATVVVISRFRSDDPVAASAEMHTSDGAAVGLAELRDTDPVTVEVDLTPWAAMLATYDLPEDAEWSLTVDIAEHRQETFSLTAGDWTTEVTVDGADPDDVRSIALVDDTGRIWCTGSFD